MMQELKDLLSEGGKQKMFTKYSVNIGDNTWNGIYSYLGTNYPDNDKNHYSIYRIDGIYEENEQKFAVLQNRNDSKYYRVNFSLSGEGETVEVVNSLIEVTSSYEPLEGEQFAPEEVETYENTLINSEKSSEN
jgi:hypothetical protein